MNSNTDRQTFTEILADFVGSLGVHMFNAGQHAAGLCMSGDHDTETQLRKRQNEILNESVAKITALAEKIDAANGDNTFDVTPFILPKEEPAQNPVEAFLNALRADGAAMAPPVLFSEEPATQEMPVVTGEPVTDPAQVRSV